MKLQSRPHGRTAGAERARARPWLAQQGEAEGDIAGARVVALGRLPHLGLFGAADAADEQAVDAALAETETEARWPTVG